MTLVAEAVFARILGPSGGGGRLHPGALHVGSRAGGRGRPRRAVRLQMVSTARASLLFRDAAAELGLTTVGSH